MKRIANNVALQTILYTIPGTQKIRIIDVNDSMWLDNGGECVYQGTEYEFSKASTYKLEHAQVHRISVADDYIVFTICLNNDVF